MKWKKDIPKVYLEEKWKTLLKMIQVYVTCEGRYGRTMLYHFKILLHFTGMQPLNMPFYLLRVLPRWILKFKPSLIKLATVYFIMV
jgi:hypothetical protein